METVIGTPAPNCHILTNSPALHSLKRQQLVRLCKRNGVKATGTNSDIVEKLKACASNHQYSPSARGGGQSNFSSDDEGDKENKRSAMSRPSEAWSVIEEDSQEVERVQLGLQGIREEVEQEMQNTSPMKGFGATTPEEFGNRTTSSKSSTVTSSLKAFASSLRLGSKMSTTALNASMMHKMHTEEPPINDALPPTSYYEHTQSYPLLPSPQKLDADDSQDQSILNLGASTIRLVTTAPRPPSPPALQAFTPTFEHPCSPSLPSVPSLYPPLPADDDSDHLPPGAFPGSSNVPSAPAKLSSPAALPFVFGSPAHRTSNVDFNVAAASVLAEMNARLGLTGTSDAVGLDLLQKRPEHKFSLFSHSEAKPQTDVTNKFNRAHEREFEKMEGLGEWYARRNASSPGKSDPVSKKRKCDALDNGLRRGAIRPSNLINPHRSRISGAGTPATGRSIVDRAQAEETDQRESKRVRISVVEGGDTRIKPVQTEVKDDESDMVVDEQPTPEERERERAAIKKRLEVSRARRRSSMGRVSVGGGRPPLIPNQPKKGTATKFGFLSSAKTLVKSVWNRGVGMSEQVSKLDTTTAPTPKATTILPVKKTSVVLMKPPSSKQNVTKPPETKALTGKIGPNSSLRVPAGGLGLGRMSSTKARTNSTLSTRSSAISSNTARLSTASSSSSVISAARRGPIPSFSRTSRTNSIASSNRVPAPRTCATGTGASRSTGASSIGIKKATSTPTSSVRSSDAGKGSTSGFARKRTVSTLFAPTASSLARMQSNIRPPSLPNIASQPSRSGFGSLVKVSEQLPAPTTSGAPAVAFASPRTERIVSPPIKAAGSIFPDGPPAFSPMQAPPSEMATPKPRALPPRRPRISRSRVIAKVGAQRATSGGSSLARTASGRRSLNAPRTRGSVGLRSSGIGAKSTARNSVAMSARKRMRQSEILRRRSKVSGISPALLDLEETQSRLEDDKECDETREATSASIDVSMDG